MTRISLNIVNTLTSPNQHAARQKSTGRTHSNESNQFN